MKCAELARGVGALVLMPFALAFLVGCVYLGIVVALAEFAVAERT